MNKINLMALIYMLVGAGLLGYGIAGEINLRFVLSSVGVGVIMIPLYDAVGL